MGQQAHSQLGPPRGHLRSPEPRVGGVRPRQSLLRCFGTRPSQPQAQLARAPSTSWTCSTSLAGPTPTKATKPLPTCSFAFPAASSPLPLVGSPARASVGSAKKERPPSTHQNGRIFAIGVRQNVWSALCGRVSGRSLSTRSSSGTST